MVESYIYIDNILQDVHLDMPWLSYICRGVNFWRNTQFKNTPMIKGDETEMPDL